MATGLLTAFFNCGRSPTPREDRASGAVLLSGNRPEAQSINADGLPLASHQVSNAHRIANTGFNSPGPSAPA